MPDQAKPDYKIHAQPAGHALPDAGDLAKREPGWVKAGRRKNATKRSARRRRTAQVHPARRPALRQRRHPHRPRGQQKSSRTSSSRRDAVRLRRALRAGLGLPRLPIELQVEKTHGKAIPPAQFRELCRSYAAEQIERQKPTSSASACSATGIIPIAPWISS